MTTATVEKDHALSNAKAKLKDIVKWYREYQVLTDISDNELVPIKIGDLVDGVWVKTIPDNDPKARNEDDLRKEAEQSVLSVEYRQSCWQSVGSKLVASQGRLLLPWGGPSCQIITDLDEHGEPSGNVEIQYQDWFKPWQGYWPSDDIDNASNDEARTALEWFVSLFFYG